MKKLFLMLMMFFSLMANAQKDVTKFLGIPVDGYKAEMKKKLVDKGFTYNARNDCFQGEFNGYDVNVYIATNSNKVWRIMVCDAHSCGEGDIKIRFNHLCSQFSRNKNYFHMDSVEKDFIISENENISYEMTINNKRYQASYYQAPDPEKMDTLVIQNRIKDALLKEFTQEQIDNPTEKQAEEMRQILAKETTNVIYEAVKNKSVWFMITENYGKYYISMFYDNEYNHSDGEDL